MSQTSETQLALATRNGYFGTAIDVTEFIHFGEDHKEAWLRAAKAAVSAAHPKPAITSESATEVKEPAPGACVHGVSRYGICDLCDSPVPQSLPVAVAVQAEPEGWKLVPIEPTKAMRRAGGDHFVKTSGHWSQVAGGAYREMLAVAPAHPKPAAQSEGEPMVDMVPPATSRDRWMYKQGRLAELEDQCARIKAADDAAAMNDYMLDSDDCISVLRGTWKGPLQNDCPKPAAPATAELPKPAFVIEVNDEPDIPVFTAEQMREFRAPATADEAVSDALKRAATIASNRGEYEIANAILALRSGASAQHAEGGAE